MAKCIHCERDMMCNQGVAHHKCSHEAQAKLDELNTDLMVKHTESIYLTRVVKGLRAAKEQADVWSEGRYVFEKLGLNDLLSE